MTVRKESARARIIRRHRLEESVAYKRSRGKAGNKIKDKSHSQENTLKRHCMSFGGPFSKRYAYVANGQDPLVKFDGRGIVFDDLYIAFRCLFAFFLHEQKTRIDRISHPR
jgi:hypothetical protein